MNSRMISVVIPAYNAESYIHDAILTVFNQSFRPVEIIIVDDGSVDATAHITEKSCHEISLNFVVPEKHNDLIECKRWRFAPKDDSFQILYAKQHNGGPSRARNRGIQLSRADIVALLDVDDSWSQDKLELQMELLQAGPCDFVFTNTTHVDSLGTQRMMFNPLPGVPFQLNDKVLEEPWRDLIRTNYITTSSVLALKTCFSEGRLFNEKRRLAEDWELWLAMSDHFSFGYVPEPCVTKFEMLEGLSGDSTGMIVSSIEVLENYLMSKFNLSSADQVKDDYVKKTLFAAYKWAGYHGLKIYDGRLAREYLKKALKVKIDLQTLAYYARASIIRT